MPQIFNGEISNGRPGFQTELNSWVYWKTFESLQILLGIGDRLEEKTDDIIFYSYINSIYIGKSSYCSSYFVCLFIIRYLHYMRNEPALRCVCWSHQLSGHTGKIIPANKLVHLSNLKIDTLPLAVTRRSHILQTSFVVWCHWAVEMLVWKSWGGHQISCLGCSLLGLR